MGNGINLKILGDYSPFSNIGKSIGYQLNIGNSIYLIDCGAPLFQEVGGYAIKDIDGLIITHCHDDHKRWFTDLALFHMYVPDVSKKLKLLTIDTINEELIRSSGSALNTSLSITRKNVVDLAYEDYIDFHRIGPRSKYGIVDKDEGNGKSSLYVSDINGNTVGPDKAKIVISHKTGKRRMLFKDPDYGEWIEPENFYPFSSEIFYEKEKNVIVNKEGFTIEAINAHVWHGLTGIGLKIKTEEETLIISSDTVHDKELWKELHTEKVPPQFVMSKTEFDGSSVIYGDINDYTERIWSEERYREAINTFDNNDIVLHDVAFKNSVVHTDYERLEHTELIKEKTILTHSPDTITSEWVLCQVDKTFKIKGDTFFEVVGDDICPMNADVYHKDGKKYFVGYKNDKGNYTVYIKDKYLELAESGRSDLGALI